MLSLRNASGHWEGLLSSSALSTATAVTALALATRNGALPGETTGPLIRGGLEWLARHQNADGGWGDTIRSLSNISTTTLVWAAFGVDPTLASAHTTTVDRVEAWLRQRVGSLDSGSLADKIIARYGTDRTFSVPILTMCALSGRFGTGAKAWKRVIPLPFELAACPKSWFAALRLPVVSYALPALIAIGYARHFHAPMPVWSPVRNALKPRAFQVLDTIQPPNGGFLEATPLTSFVVMSLVSSGEAKHPVAKRGLDFLIRSAQPDGSWQIDTNLATWVTTLSVHALGDGEVLKRAERETLRQWLLGQQYRERHPYTGAAPGGWAWTDLPGGVPDADDTPGALLALRSLDGETPSPETVTAASAGVRWLLDLQNRDGGMPTFCRGWGKLPFDRSSADLSAHALRAWHAWRPYLPDELQARVDRATGKALRFLQAQQEPAGAWAPLWFGNEAEGDESNRVYGTSRVLLALATTGQVEQPPARRAAEWLLRVQRPDGGWNGGEGSGPSSTEETALALEALAAVAEHLPSSELQGGLARGAAWLMDRVEDGSWTRPNPIGFYFAKLWYFEQMYPITYTVAALRRLLRA